MAVPVDVARPTLGTFGEFARTDGVSAYVGAMTSDGLRPHAAIAVASGGAHGEWIVVLAESGLWLLEGESLATRARLFADANGDVATSPDGLHLAFGACDATGSASTKKPRCGVDVREFPGLEREHFFETDSPSRIRWSQDGTELAIASRAASTTTIATLAPETTKRYPSTGAVNDATFIGKDAVAFGNDDDTTLVVDRATNAVSFDHLAAIGHRVRRDQNAGAYDAARDRLFSGGNDNKVWTYDGVAGKSVMAHDAVAFANDVIDFVLLPSGDLVVALDSGSLDERRVGGRTTHLLGLSVGSVSYGARIALGKHGDVVGVLACSVARWKIGDVGAAQSPFFARYPNVRRFAHDEASYLVLEWGGEAHVAWVPTSPPGPLAITPVDLGVMSSPTCAIVHDGFVCFEVAAAPRFSGAPTGAASFSAPAAIGGAGKPDGFPSVVAGYFVFADAARHVFAVDAHGAKTVGRIPHGVSGASGFDLGCDAASGKWTASGTPLATVVP
ncbi:hypothetical protein BH09MYX1_BH09MYX1_47870 [soil metagenome]